MKPNTRKVLAGVGLFFIGALFAFAAAVTYAMYLARSIPH